MYNMTDEERHISSYLHLSHTEIIQYKAVALRNENIHGINFVIKFNTKKCSICILYLFISYNDLSLTYLRIGWKDLKGLQCFGSV